MACGLYELILSDQNGNEESVNVLIGHFSKLLEGSAYHVNVEDAYNDLLLAFLELVYRHDFTSMANKSDGAITNYFACAIHREAVRIKKRFCVRRDNEQHILDLGDRDSIDFERKCSVSDVYHELDFTELERHLTPKEYDVICKIFRDGLPVTRVAEQYGQTRQAIHGVKKKALKKIEKLL